jgi:hypothetical protein
MLATKSNSYTFQKDGVWYFSRRVPADLRRHYRTGRIAYSLRTKSIRDARVRAMSDAAKLDRHWHIMRISSDDITRQAFTWRQPEEKRYHSGAKPAVQCLSAIKRQNIVHQLLRLAVEAVLRLSD